MVAKIIYSPNRETIEGPLIYLGGPKPENNDWQSLAIQYIQAWFPSVNIANPRGFKLEDNLSTDINNGPIIQGYTQLSPFGSSTIIEMIAPLNFWLDSNRNQDTSEKDQCVDIKTDWKTFYSRRAAREGCILFWIPKEQELNDNLFYYELGEWRVLHKWKGSKVVVGMEAGFVDEKYLKTRLSQDCPSIPLCSSLEQTCKEAIKAVMKK